MLRCFGGAVTVAHDATREMTVYSIRVEGSHDACWPECCAGLTITDHGDGSATLRGPLADVATLRRVLLALSACGLAVVTVRRAAPCVVSS
jgi:hypothetical protein